jgi:hypothetical protein
MKEIKKKLIKWLFELRHLQPKHLYTTYDNVSILLQCWCE